MTEKSCVPDTAAVCENLQRVREQIEDACARCGRSRDEVRLMAVTKTVEAARINAAIRQGVTLIGENRVQEYRQKQPELLPVETHLIGHLQTNKVSRIVGQVAMIQSVDSLHLAQAIEQEAVRQNRCVEILAEVNIGGELSKSGVTAAEAAEFCAALREMPHLRLRGLMTVPPICETESEKRKYFSKMYQLFIDIQGKIVDNKNMNILSMGMSDDFVQAIQEGSTLVRVGSAIFGKRQYTV